MATLETLARDARALCKRTWWVFLIGGIASVVFGILALINPGVALLVLGLFFAAYLLIDGAVNIWGSITHRGKDGWWILLLLGLLGVLLGGFMLVVPPASMLALVYLVALAAVFVGVALLSLGWKIRKAVSNEWVLYLTGALSVALGLVIAANPGIGALSVVYMIGSWAILIGILRIWIAVRVKDLPEHVDQRLKAAAPRRD